MIHERIDFNSTNSLLYDTIIPSVTAAPPSARPTTTLQEDPDDEQNFHEAQVLHRPNLEDLQCADYAEIAGCAEIRETSYAVSALC